MRAFSTLLILLFLLVTLPFVAAQSTADPVEVLRDAALLGRISTLEARITLRIHGSRGMKLRELSAFIEREDDATRSLIQVISPVFLSNLKFLSIASSGDRTQWMSTSRGVREIAWGSDDQRLFDSDFTSQDLSDYDPDNYQLSLHGTAEVDGETCHVLHAVPVDSRSRSERRVLYVSVESALLRKAEFYEDDTVARRFELLERMDLDGVPFPKVGKMSTLEDGTYTILTVTEARVGHDIPDALFDPESL